MTEKNSASEEARYAEMAHAISDPETLAQANGELLVGDAAATAGRTFMLESYGSEAALQEAMRPGRPKLGAGYGRGSSQEVRGRVTAEQKSLIDFLREKTGKSESQIVRDAIDALLRQEHLVG